MPLYEMTNDAFRALERASFTDLKVRERDDLQRLLRAQIAVLDDGLYVLTEEFGDWDDSRRRIDLLAIDQDANLVVVELKRTNDGGHMELQSIRYASMVSVMTFERAVSIHGEFLGRTGESPEDARNRILAFLDWDEPSEENFAMDVRIVLVSEDFGKELTTAVLWLRNRGIDIRCIRLRPYLDGELRLVDVQQIIPLPEAIDYQIQIREKEQVERAGRVERHEKRLRFWEGLITLAHRRNTRHANIKPGHYHWLGASSGIRGLGYNYVVGQDYGSVELYIDRGDRAENKQIFDQLFGQKEGIETTFGGSLSWERLEAKRASRIKALVESGGWRSPSVEWPAIHAEMVDGMTRLETALKSPLESLGY